VLLERAQQLGAALAGECRVAGIVAQLGVVGLDRARI